MSLFSKLASENVNTYAIGQDGGAMADLAAAIARGEISDMHGAKAFVDRKGLAKDDEVKVPSPRMDYEFTGVSIWLELDAEDEPPIQAQIDRYQGLGNEPLFPVHATVLYSMDEALLDGGDEEFMRNRLQMVVDSLPTKLIFLTPKRLVYFLYPKTADNGNGFGCLMPFFLIKPSPPLVQLFEKCKDHFPPDERHGGRVQMRRIKSENSLLDLVGEGKGKWTTSSKPLNPKRIVQEKGATLRGSMTPRGLAKRGRSGSFHALSTGKAYTPHLSIAYLDMSRTDIMNESVCENIVKENPETMQPVRAKYLSAWWTKGKVEDWKRICKVALY